MALITQAINISLTIRNGKQELSSNRRREFTRIQLETYRKFQQDAWIKTALATAKGDRHKPHKPRNRQLCRIRPEQARISIFELPR